MDSSRDNKRPPEGEEREARRWVDEEKARSREAEKEWERECWREKDRTSPEKR